MTDLIASNKNPNVLKNIFKITECVIPEDRFTAAWGYLLDRDPCLAQSVAGILLEGKGLPVKVTGVTDHPKYNSLKQPDFRIECEGFDILVEHKLDALLHDKQLESYLELELQGTYLALIAPAHQSVPAEVLAHPFYLKPVGRDHFGWSDFHGTVESQTGWLAQEFAEYMNSLGMAPFTLKCAEDIFDLRAKPVQFDEALKLAAEQVFVRNSPGFWLKGTQTGRGREVRSPSPTLTLIYIWAEQRSSQVREFDGPVLAVNVYEQDILKSCILGDATIMTPSGLPVHRRQLDRPLQQGAGACRVTYVAPLVQIIQETRESTVQSMAEMLAVVRSDFIESQAVDK